MRVLLVSDIHSNLTAFQAVLNDAERHGGWDRIWNMGDIVGYGPEPTACLDLLTETEAASVAGNHDWATVGKVPLTDFNAIAAQANLWTSRQLRPDHTAYLETLPLLLHFGDFTLAHGSPRDPIWEYLMDRVAAMANFALLPTQHGVVGHSHVALAFYLNRHTGECHSLTLHAGRTLELDEGRWIINPGSVGQPRDGDPRAAYAIMEDGAVTAHRVEYNIIATQIRMQEVGLPDYLADRLSYGR